MIDYFDKLYNSITNRSRILSKLKFYSLIRLAIRLIANFSLPVYFKLTNKNKRYLLNPNEKGENRIIISLTSFPARINRLWFVIETILRQTKKPDKIILYLSKTQFPLEKTLPKTLLKQKKRGLEIVLVNDDFRSHKKYLYTLKSYPNDYLLTIDDDIFYRSKMIENLYNSSLQYPSTIIAQYCSKMIWENGELASYCEWNLIDEETEPSFNIFFGSGGGVLFPPNSFYKDTINEEMFMSICPSADDVWLNAMCRLNKIPVKKIQCSTSFLPIINKKNKTLDKINNGMKQNDVQIHSIRNYYQIFHNIEVFTQQ